MLTPRVHMFALAVSFALLAISVSADAQPRTVTPRNRYDIADVFVHMARVRGELELLRREMGGPKNERPEIEAFDAHPREVFAQALTLLGQANRLTFELVRERAPMPMSPNGVIDANHVYAVVDETLARIRTVKDNLGIRETSQPPSRDPDKSPTDVLRSTIQASRQLNLLLERRLSSTDVFQQVTVAVGYAARLLEQFPATRSIPTPPPLERHKRSSDVYGRLLACFQLVREIVQTSEIAILDLQVDDETVTSVAAGDGHDIASLLVAELAYLHTQLDAGVSPVDSFYPGRKFPSHTYQRAGLLELQLTALAKRVRNTPDWLGQRHTP